MRLGWSQKVTNEKQPDRNLLQQVILNKLQLFGQMCGLNYGREIKSFVTGIMDGKHKVGRPHREWADDVLDRCKASLQELNYCAHDRTKW